MNIIIVGGGLTGLVACKAVLSKYPTASITLLEKSPRLGGLLDGISYGEKNLYFDLGTHIFQETGINFLDSFLLNSLPAENLIHFPTGLGDFAGTVFNDNLQINSHFPDLRGSAKYSPIISSLRKHISEHSQLPSLDRLSSLVTSSFQRFGIEYTEAVILPTLSRVFNLPIDSLAAFALLLPGWTRVVIDDYAERSTNINDSTYSQISAIPDQRQLPLSLHHGRRSFYSKTNGTRSFIAGMYKHLSQHGVNFVLNASNCSVDVRNMHVCWTDESKKDFIQVADHIILSVGVLGASKLLNIDLSQFSFDPPIPYRVINLVLDQSSRSDLCYLYGLDKSCDWYRVTNYSAITGNPDDCRLSVELLGTPRNPLDVLPQLVVDHLYSLDFLSTTKINFSDIVTLPNGYPVPSISNLNSMCELGGLIESMLPPNILVGGVGTNGGLFFQNELSIDLYSRIISA